MSYILFYAVYNRYDNGAWWEDRIEEYETYDDLIKDCSGLVFRNGNEIKLKSIFKLENNMLDLFGKDIYEGVIKMEEEEERRLLLRLKLEEERKKQLEEESEEREFALFKELCKKYGNGEN